MRKIIIIGIFCFTCFTAWTQYPYDNKRDNIWLFGYNDGNHYNPDFGVTQIEFEDTNRVIALVDSFADFVETIGIACDTNGSLLFSTNGIWIYDKYFNNMQGYDTLTPGYVSKQSAKFGYIVPQGVLMLPQPDHENSFYIFHERLANFPDTSGYPAIEVYYSIVDVNQNFGLGVVASLRNPIIDNETLDYGKLQACRHANGRDWWIVFCNSDLTKYRRLLLDNIGVHDYGWFNTGLSPIPYGGGLGQASFTPDGSKYVLFNSIGSTFGEFLDIYNFDRCTGFLDSHSRLNTHDNSFNGGLAISSNSRFIYTSTGFNIYQYDLLAPNIFSSKLLVATYDSFTDPSSSLLSTYFYLMARTPDGKILISTPNSTHYLHVINDPNQLGAACNIIQHQIQLLSFNKASMANYPNFRLGPLMGSACDTLTGLGDNLRWEKEKVIKVFPNPATDFIVVDYGFIDWNKGEISLEIQNELGQSVYTQKVPMYSSYQKVNVSSFAAGFYIANIKRQNTLVATAKFVKQ